MPDVRVSIPEMEGQLPCAGHLDMVDPLGKGLLIKCFKAHCAGGFLQDDLYVFVVDLNTGRYVAHGTNLRLINTDFSKVRFSGRDGIPAGKPTTR